MTATADASSPKQIDWNSIDWNKVEHSVKRLQIRIAEAVKQKKLRKAKSLQWLLTHSFTAKLLAVKRVTENRGRKTPGIDGVTWQTPLQKIKAVKSLSRRGYKPKPLRRVYIPKRNGKRRPLSIPTIKDRAMQALHLLALAPVAETTADPNSYGFREQRCCADAIEQCFLSLAKRYSPQWILEADIKSCFDTINHKWVEQNVLMDKRILAQWLKAGCIWKGRLYPTEAGTPQGGVISPTLANLTLDGLESAIKSAVPASAKVNVIRYADDFVVTGNSYELLELQVKPTIVKFLAQRGLVLSEEKSQITNINTGFDFLGQNVRKYKEKLLITPSKKSIKLFLQRVRRTIKENKHAKQASLITRLNLMIRGWVGYHRFIVANKAFQYIDHHIFLALWQWSRKRHPRKPAKWIIKRYFHSVGLRNWIFASQGVELVKASDTAIKRHLKVRGAANPYDPTYREYFISRKLAEGKIQRVSKWYSLSHC